MDFGIEGEAAPVPDRVGPQGLHLGAGFFAVECDRFIARQAGSTRQSENVVDAARPDQRIVPKIAFPAPDVMHAEPMDVGRRDRVRDDAVDDQAEFEMASLLGERPAVDEGKGCKSVHLRPPSTTSAK